jgi:tol-pal system protein YbgF
VAVIQSSIQQNLRDQESKVVTPVVGLSTRMDQVSSETHALQQAVADLTGLISRMQTQMTDLNNAVKVLAAPPPPPPVVDPSSGGQASAVPDTPSISATDLYENAMRDRQGGKLELAAQQFTDYLRWYGNTELAPNAQYYLAWIHQQQKDYENALREFDMVLEKYPDNNKTPDALFGKGSVLVKMGRRTDGAREFQDLMKRFPKHALAAQACTQLTGLGYRCSTGAAAKGGKKK